MTLLLPPLWVAADGGWFVRDVTAIEGESNIDALWAVYTDSQTVGTPKAVQTGATALISLKALIHTIMDECVALDPPLPCRARAWRMALNAIDDATVGVAVTTPAELLPPGWPDIGGKSHRHYNYKGARGEGMLGPDPMLFDGVHRAIMAAGTVET